MIKRGFLNKITGLVLGVLISVSVFSQGNKCYKITYASFNHGERAEHDMHLYFHKGLFYMSSEKAKIQRFINFDKAENISLLTLGDSLYKKAEAFSDLPKGQLSTEKEETILGYPCQRMDFVYFSNHISVWFTEKAPCKGSPLSYFIPSSKAMVLKASINGNRSIVAQSIEKIKKLPRAIYSDKEAREVNDAEFEELKIKSRFVSLRIFDKEQIHFAPQLYKNQTKDLQQDSVYHFAKGSVILKKISLTEVQARSPFVFARLACQSNGDAYDRTGSVFVFPASEPKETLLKAYLEGLDQLPVYTDNKGAKYQGIIKTQNYNPPIELIRFFTPFGVHHFNEKRAINNYNWADEAIYKQDVSQVWPMEKELWVGVFIGNYDGGGHKVSLDLNFYPDEEAPDSLKNVVIPLVSTINTLEMQGQNYGRLFRNDTLEMDFDVPENLIDPHFIYTSTGHGGWGGGDEFNPKLNRIIIDGKELFSFTPWRTDCASYRLLNPASGNFENGLSSSDFSRSNWCPGTLTPPYLIPSPKLKPGKHHLKIIIDQGEDAGNSFSHWGLSLILSAKKKSNNNK